LNRPSPVMSAVTRPRSIRFTPCRDFQHSVAQRPSSIIAASLPLLPWNSHTNHLNRLAMQPSASDQRLLCPVAPRFGRLPPFRSASVSRGLLGHRYFGRVRPNYWLDVPVLLTSTISCGLSQWPLAFSGFPGSAFGMLMPSPTARLVPRMFERHTDVCGTGWLRCLLVSWSLSCTIRSAGNHRMQRRTDGRFHEWMLSSRSPLIRVVIPMRSAWLH
jgi:hypothetical protein